MTDDEIRRIQGEHLVMLGSREAIIEGAIKAGRAIIAQARAEMRAEMVPVAWRFKRASEIRSAEMAPLNPPAPWNYRDDNEAAAQQRCGMAHLLPNSDYVQWEALAIIPSIKEGHEQDQ
jgi:hypothetical protein